MKRFLSIVALCLFMLLFVTGDVYSTARPLGYTETENPDGDDHPWGGDEVGDGGSGDSGISPISTREKDIVPIMTTYYDVYDLSIYFIGLYYKTIEPLFYEKTTVKKQHRTKYENRKEVKNVRVNFIPKQR